MLIILGIWCLFVTLSMTYFLLTDSFVGDNERFFGFVFLAIPFNIYIIHTLTTLIKGALG